MRFEYRNDRYYYDCHHGNILVCFINRAHHNFTLNYYHTSNIALFSYDDFSVSPSETMLRIITSLVLL